MLAQGVIGLVDARVDDAKLFAGFLSELREINTQFPHLFRQGQEVLREQDAQHRLAHLGMRGDGIEDLPQRVIRRQVEFRGYRGHSVLSLMRIGGRRR